MRNPYENEPSDAGYVRLEAAYEEYVDNFCENDQCRWLSRDGEKPRFDGSELQPCTYCCEDTDGPLSYEDWLNKEDR